MKANNIEMDNYDNIEEKDTKDVFDEYMDLLFPECVESGNEYEGSIVDTQLLITN